MSKVFLASVVLALAAPVALLADAPSMSYNRAEPAAIVKSPQNYWARALLFDDEILAFPDGRPQRLDRRNYFPMTLRSVGTAWIRDDHVEAFEKLPHGTRFSFGGTVDQISRRYYIILDAAYTVETTPTMQEIWTDVLANPPAGPAPEPVLGDVPLPDAPAPATAASSSASTPPPTASSPSTSSRPTPPISCP